MDPLRTKNDPVVYWPQNLQRTINKQLAIQTVLYALIMVGSYDTKLPSETEVTEAVTCEERLIDPIQKRSEEETEEQHNYTIDFKRNNSNADLKSYLASFRKAYQR